MYSRTIDFNTESILSEIDKVIKDGLNKLLSEHLNRYELLEKTHQAIMSLPSVLNELNQQPCNIYNSKPQFQEKEKDTDFKSKSMMLFTEDLIKKELDKQYESIMPLFEKMLTKIENLSKEVNELKNKNTKDILDLTVSREQIEVEKENIRLEIEETSELELENDIEDTDEQEDDNMEEDDNELLVEDDEEEQDDVEEQEDEVEEQRDEEEQEDIEDDEELVEENDVVNESDEEVQEEEHGESDDAVQQDDDIETENSEEEPDEEAEEVINKEESDEEVQEEEEEEEELFEIDIDDVTYCTNNEENGFIYQLSKDGDVGTKVGYFKDGEPFFYADEN